MTRLKVSSRHIDIYQAGKISWSSSKNLVSHFGIPASVIGLDINVDILLTWLSQNTTVITVIRLHAGQPGNWDRIPRPIWDT
jgi:hypothetical protein